MTRIRKSVRFEASGSDPDFPYTATVDGECWRVRINDWPADPTMYTLVVDGVAVEDVHRWPDAWTCPIPPTRAPEAMRAAAPLTSRVVPNAPRAGWISIDPKLEVGPQLAAVPEGVVEVCSWKTDEAGHASRLRGIFDAIVDLPIASFRVSSALPGALADALAGPPKRSGLRRMTLEGSLVSLSEDDARALGRLAQRQAFQALTLTECNVRSTSVFAALFDELRTASLSVLTIRGKFRGARREVVELPSSALGAWFQSDGATNLRVLDLCGTDFGPDGARQIGAASSLRSLDTLRLEGCEAFDHDALAFIAGSTTLSSLRDLDLRATRAGNRAHELLQGPRTLNALARVGLSDAGYTVTEEKPWVDWDGRVIGSGPETRSLRLEELRSSLVGLALDVY